MNTDSSAISSPDSSDLANTPDTRALAVPKEVVVLPPLVQSPGTAEPAPSLLPTSHSDFISEPTLHPVDRGLHAWLFVLSAFVLEFLIWGFAFSYGVFQEYFLTHEPFSVSSEASINAVGTVTLGLQYCLGLVSVFIVHAYPKWVRHVMMLCLCASVGSLFASSFATKIWHLIVLQGVINGAAGGILYPIVMVWLPEWFDKRRNLASSVLQAGSAIGGIVFPLVITTLLKHIGYAWTIRAFSFVLGIFATPAVLSVKPRLPFPRNASQTVVEGNGHTSQLNNDDPEKDQVAHTLAPFVTQIPSIESINKKEDGLGYLKSPVFLSVLSTVFVQGLGHFCVSFYVTTYTVALGYSRIQGTVALSIFNAAFVIAEVLTGHYCDKNPYTTVMIVTNSLACVIVFGLWGFATTFARIIAFVVIFGALSGSFLAVWTPAVTDVAGSNGSPFMILMIFKGASAIVGPMIASVLHPKHVVDGHDMSCSSDSATVTIGASQWGACGFRDMIIFVGATMAGATLISYIAILFRRRRDR